MLFTSETATCGGPARPGHLPAPAYILLSNHTSKRHQVELAAQRVLAWPARKAFFLSREGHEGVFSLAKNYKYTYTRKC